jgi:four helix bundle protein
VSKLVAWLKRMDLVEKIYELTKKFPRQEIYGLSSQMRRAAISVPSNIDNLTVSKLLKRVDRVAE